MLATQAVKLRDESGKPIMLEASGGVNLEKIGDIAATGVDRISVPSTLSPQPSAPIFHWNYPQNCN